MNIFGSIGAVVMLIIMLPVLLRWVDTGLIAQQQRVVSTHLSMVTRAARQYVNKHQDTLLSRASASAGPTVSINDLITDGFLNEGFSSHKMPGFRNTKYTCDNRGLDRYKQLCSPPGDAMMIVQNFRTWWFLEQRHSSVVQEGMSPLALWQDNRQIPS